MGAIMVSIVITLIGMLKKFAFNHIKNKQARKTALATSNIIFSYATTAGFFWLDSKDWKWFMMGGAITTFTCIVVYFFYENFHLREVIHAIGNFAISKIVYVAKLAFHKNADELKVEAQKACNEVKEFAKNELKKKKRARADEELKNL
jgi:hypothetical protein